MLFSKGSRGERSDWAATLRDIVEIVAILLAGIWAIYIFIYENRIMPAISPPTISVAGHLTPMGYRDGFAIVSVALEVKDIGATPVQFLGYSFTVRGSHFVPQAKGGLRDPDGITSYPYYSFGPESVVYRKAFVTVAGDPSAHADIYMDPGQDNQESVLVYVPHQFEHIVLYVDMNYIKASGRIVPTTLSYSARGLPHFSSKSDGDNVDSVNEPIAETDVSAR